MTITSVGILLAAVLRVTALAVFLHGKAIRAITRKAAGDGRRVVRVRRKMIVGLFAPGLTPLALVFRVTTQRTEAESKVKLYAYDPGRWFSRRATTVRQFSGGVWRDA